MGSNLNQVFISDALTMLDGSQAQFGSLAGAAAADDVGVFTLGPGTAEYKQSALYDAVIAASSADSSAGDLTLASPLWIYHSFQIVQRAVTGNNIVSPIIQSAAVKRIAYTSHVSWVGASCLVADATVSTAGHTGAIDGDDYNFKFVVTSAPTNQTNFYNNTASSIYTKSFPIGAMKSGKIINMGVVIADVSDVDAAANVTNIQNAIAAHPLLKNMVSAADVSADVVITSLVPGLNFKLLVSNDTRSTDAVEAAATAEVKGSGNDWQVADDEARCRSRQGDFNRIYIPNSVETYVQADSLYDKIVIDYETPNWPNGAGIAPAGGKNTATIYWTNAGSDPGTTGSEFATAFGFADNTDGVYHW